MPLAAIAAAVGGSLDATRMALALLRTRCRNPHRGTLNVSPWALAFVRAYARPDEKTWQTVDRVCQELLELRRRGG